MFWVIIRHSASVHLFCCVFTWPCVAMCCYIIMCTLSCACGAYISPLHHKVHGSYMHGCTCLVQISDLSGHKLPTTLYSPQDWGMHAASRGCSMRVMTRQTDRVQALISSPQEGGAGNKTNSYSLNWSYAHHCTLLSFQGHTRDNNYVTIPFFLEIMPIG